VHARAAAEAERGATLRDRTRLWVGAALTVLLLPACSGDRPPVVTIVLDGQTQTMAARVTCTDQPDGRLLIFAAPPNANGKRLIRALLTRGYRIAVVTVGIRLADVAGFTDDAAALTATKVDDTYNINGRMPPDRTRTDWLQFEIEVTCQRYERKDQPLVAP
jgi:hypothetical protein